jgi:hypothetical protein
MTWGFLWLMLVLKLPIAALLWIVWWAVHQDAEPGTGGSDEDGGTKVDTGGERPRRGGPPRPRFPRRRGPHGDPTIPAPPRVRTTVARSDRKVRD